jgi:DNA-binding CsgD family transcriptional regulator
VCRCHAASRAEVPRSARNERAACRLGGRRGCRCDRRRAHEPGWYRGGRGEQEQTGRADTRRQLHATPLHREYFSPRERSLFVGLPTVPGHTRRVLLWREEGSDFSERDRVVMELLRPHLYEVLLDAERRRSGVPVLTPRAWEVLALAGMGYGNADVARRLFISPATVRKHLEHVYDKLGVRSRAAAAALALPHRFRGHRAR